MALAPPRQAVVIRVAKGALAHIRLRVETLEPVGADVLAAPAAAYAIFTACGGALQVFGAGGALAEELLLRASWRRLHHARARTIVLRAVLLIRSRHLDRSVAAAVSAVGIALTPASNAVVSV